MAMVGGLARGWRLCHPEVPSAVVVVGLQTDQGATENCGFSVIHRFHKRLAVLAGVTSPVPGVVPGTVLRTVSGAALQGFLYIIPGALPRVLRMAAGRMVWASLRAVLPRAVGRALPRRARRVLPQGVRRIRLRAASRALWEAVRGALSEPTTRVASGTQWQTWAICLWVRAGEPAEMREFLATRPGSPQPDVLQFHGFC
jgi:hypothetical protein